MYIRSGSIRIWYETFGSDEPLLMLMGLGGTIQAWELQIPALAAHYRLICPDNRGTGRSAKPLGPYRIADMAADALAVLAAAEVESAHVLGVSMGGLIAQELYHRAPQRVRSLILGCTGTGPNDPTYIKPSVQAWDALAVDYSRPAEAIVAAMCRAFYHPSYRAQHPDLAARLLKRQQEQPQPAHAYAGQLAACWTHTPNSPRLADIQVPTLVLHGSDDEIWPLANAYYLAEHIPDAELQIIPQTGHMFMVEKPDQFNQAVLDFLARLPPKRSAARPG